MDKKMLRFQICFQLLDDNDRDELCEICGKYNCFTHGKTKGADGCIQDIVYCVIDTINDLNYKDIIICGALWDLLKFISRKSVGLMTLIVNGRKRKYSNGELLIKELGNYISKIICNSDTLYGVAEKCVIQYNKAYNENLTLNLNSLFDEKYLQIDIENNTIFLNSRIFIYLASYFFGSAKLSHLYKLTWDFIQLDNIDEAEVLYSKFITEWGKLKERVENFLNINPQWLTTQIYLTILHELGHHRYKNAPSEFEERSMFVRIALEEIVRNIEANQSAEFILRHLSDLLDESNEKEKLINFYREFIPELSLFCKEIASELICDNNYLEELCVDFFAFEHVTNRVLATTDSKLILANILAALTVNSWYIEYAQRLDTFSINPCKSDKQERLVLGVISYMQQSLRASVREYFISIYLKEISNDEAAIDLYRNLTSGVYMENNGKLDIDFLKDMEQYYVIKRQNANPKSDSFNRNRLELKMNAVELEIMNLILEGLANAHNL